MTLEMIGTQSIHPDYSNLHNIFIHKVMPLRALRGLLGYRRPQSLPATWVILNSIAVDWAI